MTKVVQAGQSYFHVVNLIKTQKKFQFRREKNFQSDLWQDQITQVKKRNTLQKLRLIQRSRQILKQYPQTIDMRPKKKSIRNTQRQIQKKQTEIVLFSNPKILQMIEKNKDNKQKNLQNNCDVKSIKQLTQITKIRTKKHKNFAIKSKQKSLDYIKIKRDKKKSMQRIDIKGFGCTINHPFSKYLNSNDKKYFQL